MMQTPGKPEDTGIRIETVSQREQIVTQLKTLSAETSPEEIKSRLQQAFSYLKTHLDDTVLLDLYCQAVLTHKAWEDKGSQLQDLTDQAKTLRKDKQAHFYFQIGEFLLAVYKQAKNSPYKIKRATVKTHLKKCLQLNPHHLSAKLLLSTLPKLSKSVEAASTKLRDTLTALLATEEIDDSIHTSLTEFENFVKANGIKAVTAGLYSTLDAYRDLLDDCSDKELNLHAAKFLFAQAQRVNCKTDNDLVANLYYLSGSFLYYGACEEPVDIDSQRQGLKRVLLCLQLNPAHIDAKKMYEEASKTLSLSLSDTTSRVMKDLQHTKAEEKTTQSSSSLVSQFQAMNVSAAPSSSSSSSTTSHPAVQDEWQLQTMSTPAALSSINSSTVSRTTAGKDRPLNIYSMRATKTKEEKISEAEKECVRKKVAVLFDQDPANKKLLDWIMSGSIEAGRVTLTMCDRLEQELKPRTASTSAFGR